MINAVRIPGFSDYGATKDGRIVRLTPGQGARAGRVLRPAVCGGYEVVCFYAGVGRRKTAYVHQLVARAYKGATPAGMEIDHKDQNSRNNHVDNLEFVSHKENMNRASWTRLTRRQVEGIKRLRGVKTHREIGRQFGISSSYVSLIQTGKQNPRVQ